MNYPLSQVGIQRGETAFHRYWAMGPVSPTHFRGKILPQLVRGPSINSDTILFVFRFFLGVRLELEFERRNTITRGRDTRGIIQASTVHGQHTGGLS